VLTVSSREWDIDPVILWWLWRYACQHCFHCSEHSQFWQFDVKKLCWLFHYWQFVRAVQIIYGFCRYLVSSYYYFQNTAKSVRDHWPSGLFATGHPVTTQHVELVYIFRELMGRWQALIKEAFLDFYRSQFTWLRSCVNHAVILMFVLYPYVVHVNDIAICIVHT